MRAKDRVLIVCNRAEECQSDECPHSIPHDEITTLFVGKCTQRGECNAFPEYEFRKVRCTVRKVTNENRKN